MKIDTLLRACGPVLHRPSLSPPERRTLTSAHAAGRVVRMLPGTYVPRELAHDFSTRVRAVAVWNIKAVVTGAAAARLSFWASVPVSVVDVALDGHPPEAAGYRFERRAIDADFVDDLHDVRLASPALAAIDLVESWGGDAIDTCLRSRRARLPDLWAALHAHPRRRGNAEVERLLRDSRDEPWSAAERLAHRLLRQHRIRGWSTNLEVRAGGLRYYIDIAFREARLALEIDGRLHEDDPDIFENDRLRQNALVLSGWRVLRFTYAMLINEPAQVIATIRRALARS